MMRHPIYLCVSNGTGSDWYTVDIFSSKGKFKFHENMNDKETPLFCGCTHLGEDIYVMGGRLVGVEKPLKNFQIFNTRSQQWKDGPNMLVERSQPLAVAISNKIYVFGGTFEKPWAEYYDVGNNKWYGLQQPPLDVVRRCRLYGHFVCNGGDGMILWDEDVFAFYDVNNDSWISEVVHRFLPAGHVTGIHTRVAFDGQRIYWCYGGDVFAYEFSSTKKLDNLKCSMLTSFGPPLVNSEHIYTSPFMVSLDNNICCLVWYDHTYNQGICSWAIITLYDMPNLIDRVEAKGSFFVHCISISHCFTMQQPNDKDKNGISVVEPIAVLKDLSRTMYTRGCLSYLRNVENANGCIPLPCMGVKAGIPLASLLKAYDLEEAEPLMKQIIDMDALKNMKVEDLKNLSMPEGSRKKVQKLEMLLKDDSDEGY